SSATLGQPRVGLVRLAGSDAAYALSSHGVDTGSSQVVVRRLRDGKVLRTAAAVSHVTGPESFTSVSALVVKADGAVAWIGEAHSIVSRAGGIEVHRFDRRGQAELDHGPGISARSLHLQASRLTWLNAGGQRSATRS